MKRRPTLPNRFVRALDDFPKLPEKVVRALDYLSLAAAGVVAWLLYAFAHYL